MPELVAESLGGRLLAFADFSPVDDDVMLVGAAVNSDASEGEFAEVHMHLPVLLCQALFLEVTAEKVDQRCSTLLLPQCGHAALPVSCSAMVRVMVNVFWHALQKYS
jgi:hypothetical protein